MSDATAETSPARAAPTEHAATRRRSGKPLAIGLLVLIVGGVAFGLGMWHWGREPKGPIQAVAAIDASEVAVLRQGFEERGYTHLGVWTADGEMRWSEALFGIQENPDPTVAGDLVLVLVTEARGNPALHAFDRETGEFRWKVAQPLDATHAADPLRATEETAWLVDADGAWQAVSLSDGTLDESAGPPRERAPRLAFRDGDSICAQITPTDGIREGRARCRTVPAMRGYDATDEVIWVFSETGLTVLDRETLEVLGGEPLGTMGIEER
jgi:hypothetical protein